MGAMNERRLISAVLRTGDIRPALDQGITVEAMPTYGEEWAWLLRQYHRTGKIPTRADFKVEFPRWAGIKDVTLVDVYAGAVAEDFAKAATFEALNRGIDDLDQGVPLAKLLENLDEGKRKVVKALGASGSVDGRLSDHRSFVREVKRRQAMASRGGAGTPYGIETLDEATGGMTAGQLVIFCSRPSVGKSWLLAKAAVEAWYAGKTCLFFTLEMNQFSVQTRMLSLLAAKDPQAQNINPSEIRKGSIGRSGVLDLSRFMKRNFGAGKGDVFIVDNSDPRNPLTEAHVQAAIERVQPDITFLDYLQLFARINARGGMDLRHEVARMSSFCKGLGDMYKIPFITASQVNRPGESKGVPPSLSTLAESDSPGQDADVVVTMAPPSRHVRRGLVAKNREGPDHDLFHLHFNPSEGCIEEVTLEAAEQIMADEVLG